MSKEISISVSLSVDKIAMESRSESISVDMAGESMVHGVQNIGTTKENIKAPTDMGTKGYMFAKNMDDTNYVEIGCASVETYYIKLKPGEIALFRCDGAPYAKAHTAAVNLEYILLEN